MTTNKANSVSYHVTDTARHTMGALLKENKEQLSVSLELNHVMYS